MHGAQLRVGQHHPARHAGHRHVGPGGDEEDVDEASVTANVAGYIAPLGADPKKDRKLDEDDVVSLNGEIGRAHV